MKSIPLVALFLVGALLLVKDAAAQNWFASALGGFIQRRPSRTASSAIAQPTTESLSTEVVTKYVTIESE